MRKIIVTEFITLDGVVEAPGGNETPHPHGGWQAAYSSPESGVYKINELKAVDALLLGKNTYNAFADYWPNQTNNDFARFINEYPKYVVSKSLKKTEWNKSYIIRNVEQDIAALKQTKGGDILVYGSATLVRSLLYHNLIDELRLMIYPVCVGGGLRIFENNLELKKFTLKSSSTFANGVIALEFNIFS
ncbi:dihydrofolate reductase family protein [Emticicia sp. 17c]|uniref:dihydrofolate reductase family protein n=1 Tax=Emticicia sp. 17c TaxID=3127704 RepID=UPI00301B93F7